MPNFDPEGLMKRVHHLEQAIERHVPAGIGGENDLAARVSALEANVEKLMQHVFETAGVGEAQNTGTTVDAAELAKKPM